MRRFTIAIAFGGLLFSSLSATADPITITGGSLDFDEGDPPGFRFQIAESPFLLGGVVFSVTPGSDSILTLPPNSAIACLFVNACFSGESVTLGATISGRGAAVVGTSADPENPVIMPAAMMFQMTTPQVPIVGQAVNVFVLEAPFEFTGSLQVFTDESFSEILYETSLIGRGTSTAALGQPEPYNTVGPYFWEESVYHFTAAAPIPEPGTLTLLGSGLASVCVARRRRRRATASAQRLSA